MTGEYARYLAAKRTVDDRALNRQVLERVCAALPDGELTVIEVGGGTGTMVCRLHDWQVISCGSYTVVDADDGLLAHGRTTLREHARSRGVPTGATGAGLRLGDLEVRFEHRELTAYLTDAQGGADLLIANALLDVVDVPSLLPGLLRLLRPGGVFWFTITYDGECSFQPEHPLDDLVLTAYHRDMEGRVRHGHPAGEPRAGRHLLPLLRSAGAAQIWAGSSDWVVFSQPDGSYPHDERHFLGCILTTIERALTGRVDATRLGTWLGARRRELAAGELIYIAHQIDVGGTASTGGLPGARDLS